MTLNATLHFVPLSMVEDLLKHQPNIADHSILAVEVVSSKDSKMEQWSAYSHFKCWLDESTARFRQKLTADGSAPGKYSFYAIIAMLRTIDPADMPDEVEYQRKRREFDAHVAANPPT